MSVYILSGVRTPSGSFMGQFANIPAPLLGAAAIEGSLQRANIDKTSVDEVFMGQVLQAGAGQAPARQAALFAGLPVSVPCTTINKVCGSGLKSILLGVQAIKCQDVQLVVAGGMENMSLAPHLIPSSRAGQKFGEIKVKDSAQLDGLWDVYSQQSMGNCAEESAQKYQITRQEQDAYAINSFKRAQDAHRSGVFSDEIVPVRMKTSKEEKIISEDEGIFKANFDKIPHLKPAFDPLKGTITAANASTLNDGGAAVVLSGEKYKDRAQFRIVSYVSHAQEPLWFTTAPLQAMENCVKKAGISFKDIDLFEINEAFSLVPLVAIKEFSLDTSKVNIYGGGVSLGHPIGQSGARIVVTLMNAMKKNKSKLGMAAICIGGGEALSLIIENIK